MKTKELRLKTIAELEKDLAALREKARHLRFKLSAQELKNTKELKEAKKDIAKILTMIKESATKESK